MIGLAATAYVALIACDCQGASVLDHVSLSPYGVVRWVNVTDKPDYGAGIDLSYAPNDFVRIHVLNTAYETGNWGGSTVDETSLLVSADLKTFKVGERFVPYFIGGGSRDWQHSDWGFQAGLGARIDINQYASVGADYSIRAWFNNKEDGILRGYLSYSF